MSNINYVAKRNIIILPFSRLSATLSCVSADNSFNDSVSDLSGLNAGEWVYVTSFTNAGNNGWHQLLSASTVNKIIINSKSALVNEAVGPNINMQAYLHGLNESYDLTFDMQLYNPQVKLIKNTITAIGGVTATVYQRTERYYDCQTSYIDEIDLPLWNEFFDSIAAAEVFGFDAYGTAANPGNVVSAKIDGQYSFQRVGQTTKFYISFRAKI